MQILIGQILQRPSELIMKVRGSSENTPVCGLCGRGGTWPLSGPAVTPHHLQGQRRSLVLLSVRTLSTGSTST